ncbi:hypothetical protein [Schnuerera sp.]
MQNDQRVIEAYLGVE